MLEFTKMHGLGNDFVVINALEQAVNLDAEQVRKIAHRRLGVGCDQVLVLRPGTDGAADFLYSVYNADGSEAEHCGNGLRCVALYLRANGLIRKDELLAQTPTGLLKICFEGDLVKVNMGCPDFEPARIPLAVAEPQQLYRTELDSGQVEFAALSMGNPHAVLRVDDVELAPVARVGAHLQRHALFPAGVNAGFMQLLDRSRIRLRVYERGVGETLACGTGACAAVVVGIAVYNLADKVQVLLPGGSLTVAWAGTGEPVWMTGPGTTVYEGRIEIVNE